MSFTTPLAGASAAEGRYCLLVGLDRDAMYAKSASASSTGTIIIAGRTIYETAP
jgi:hypothetical protein